MLINGKEVDFSKAMPMTLGDLRKLAILKVDINELSRQLEDPNTAIPDIPMLCNMFLHFAQKVSGGSISMDDLDTVPIDQMQIIAMQIFQMQQAGEESAKESSIDPNS